MLEKATEPKPFDPFKGYFTNKETGDVSHVYFVGRDYFGFGTSDAHPLQLCADLEPRGYLR